MDSTAPKLDSCVIKSGTGTSRKVLCLFCRHVMTASHKSRWAMRLRSCPEAPPATKEAFSKAKSKAPKSKDLLSAPSPLASRQPGNGHMRQFVDSITQSEVAHLDNVCARLFFDTGIPFALAHSTAWTNYHKALRPAYKPPSSKRIRGSLLDRAFDENVRETQEHLQSTDFVHNVTDGYFNVRRQHLVNFVAHTPTNNRPIVLDIKHTKDEVQSGSAIAADIINVARTIGLDKVVSVVTDNAPNMQVAWDIIEKQHPHIVCNGCAAHTINLLVKDVSRLERFSKPLDIAKSITAFVQNRPQVIDRFRAIQSEHLASDHLDKACSLVFVGETRWYTHVNCVQRLLDNQHVLFELASHPAVTRINGTQANKRAEFVANVQNPSSWHGCSAFVDALRPTSALIGRLESVTALLSDVYASFVKLLFRWRADDELQQLVLRRWEFVHTPSMGFAYFLTPKFRTRGMFTDANDKSDLNEVFQLLPTYIVDQRSLATNKKDVLREMKEYMKYVGFAAGGTADLIKNLDPQAWWSSVGSEKFPALASAALVLLSIPTSQAASERVWSINDFIHSKRRNRLGVGKASKLVILYANARVIKNERSIVDIFAGTASDHERASESEEEGNR